MDIHILKAKAGMLLKAHVFWKYIEDNVYKAQNQESTDF